MTDAIETATPDPQDTALWAEIAAAFPVDTETADATWQSLILHAGWGRRYADRMLEESRRTLYLALTGDTPIVPAQPIGFCLDIVAKLKPEAAALMDRASEMILRPAPIAAADLPDTKLADISLAAPYATTLARYEAVFGTAPDPEIWHSTDPAEIHLWCSFRLNRPRRWSQGRRTGIALTVLFWGGGGLLWYVDGRGPDAGVRMDMLAFLGAMGLASILFAIFLARNEGGSEDTASILAFSDPIKLEFETFQRAGGFGEPDGG